MSFGDLVLEEDFMEVFNKLINAIHQYPKQEDQVFRVGLGYGVNTNWQYCYSKLQDPQLLAKIDYLYFIDTGLTFRNLKDLHDLYCSFEDKGSFPNLVLGEELLSDIKAFKNVFSKKKGEKVDTNFLKILRHDDSMLI